MLPECVSEGNESESGAQRGGGEREGKEEGKRKGRKRGRERRRLRVEAASGMRMRGGGRMLKERNRGFRAENIKRS